MILPTSNLLFRDTILEQMSILTIWKKMASPPGLKKVQSFCRNSKRRNRAFQRRSSIRHGRSMGLWRSVLSGTCTSLLSFLNHLIRTKCFFINFFKFEKTFRQLQLYLVLYVLSMRNALLHKTFAIVA